MFFWHENKIFNSCVDFATTFTKSQTYFLVLGHAAPRLPACWCTWYTLVTLNSVNRMHGSQGPEQSSRYCNYSVDIDSCDKCCPWRHKRWFTAWPVEVFFLITSFLQYILFSAVFLPSIGIVVSLLYVSYLSLPLETTQTSSLTVDRCVRSNATINMHT